MEFLNGFCRTEFDHAQTIIQKSSWDLFVEHAEVWRKTWEEGRLEVRGF